jgi:hypothetical protein
MGAAVCHPARVPSLPFRLKSGYLVFVHLQSEIQIQLINHGLASVIQAKLSELTILIKNNVMISWITKRIARAS